MASNGDFNATEFQFFMNAVEKLKATSLFQEDDLKKMTDEQIYDALIEHARMQRSKCGPGGPTTHTQNKHNFNQPTLGNHTLLESIDKEQEEDLPIIMRNLHSVKSLKHFFEIRAKSSFNANNSSVQSPSLQAKDIQLEKEAKSNVLQDLFIKHSQIIEKSVEHGVGTVVAKGSSEDAKIKLEQSLQSQREETTSDYVYNEPLIMEKEEEQEPTVPQVRPLPPPLPDFLLNSTQPSLSFKARTQSCSNTAISAENNYGSSNDLHEKLIKEIHNKSLERSRKDASICLDERGNLIVKPSNRAFGTGQKNQKLHKIKDSSYSSQSNYNSIKSVNGSVNVVAEKISLLTQSSERPSMKTKNYIKNRAHVTNAAHNQIYQDRAEILNKLECLMQKQGIL